MGVMIIFSLSHYRLESMKWPMQSAREQTYYVLSVKEVGLDDLLDLLD